MVWEDVEFDADKIPNIKLGIHVGQIVFSIVVWVLEIVVFRAATVNGQNGWTFAVCFLSIPAWIYLCMAPRFPRTRHLAEPHVMVVVDCLFTILWLSAFATQASYNTAGLCGTACPSSMAIVGMGFFVFLFFGITAFLSIYSLHYYRFHGRLPGYDRIGAGKDGQNIDPDKAAFSTAPYGAGGVMGGNDEEAYHPINHGDNDHDHDPMDPRHDNVGGGGSAYGGASHTGSMGYSDAGRHESPYGQGRQSSPYGQDDPYSRPPQLDNPFSQGSHQNNPFEDDHGYTPQPSKSPAPPAGGAQHGAVMSNQGIYIPPTAHDDYDDGRPVQFPAGNYDRAT